MDRAETNLNLDPLRDSTYVKVTSILTNLNPYKRTFSIEDDAVPIKEQIRNAYTLFFQERVSKKNIDDTFIDNETTALYVLFNHLLQGKSIAIVPDTFQSQTEITVRDRQQSVDNESSSIQQLAGLIKADMDAMLTVNTDTMEFLNLVFVSEEERRTRSVRVNIPVQEFATADFFGQNIVAKKTRKYQNVGKPTNLSVKGSNEVETEIFDVGRASRQLSTLEISSREFWTQAVTETPPKSMSALFSPARPNLN